GEQQVMEQAPQFAALGHAEHHVRAHYARPSGSVDEPVPLPARLSPTRFSATSSTLRVTLLAKSAAARRARSTAWSRVPPKARFLISFCGRFHVSALTTL